MAFKIISRIDGYGSWKLTVLEGSYNVGRNHYKIKVTKGIRGFSETDPSIENKIFYLPMDNTVIEEDEDMSQPF